MPAPGDPWQFQQAMAAGTVGGPAKALRIEPEPDTYLTTGRLQKRVDELLEKISRSGEASLTEEERKFLAEASRRYQQRRR